MLEHHLAAPLDLLIGPSYVFQQGGAMIHTSNSTKNIVFFFKIISILWTSLHVEWILILIKSPEIISFHACVYIFGTRCVHHIDRWQRVLYY